ncbi:neurotensin receptor type 1-like [Hoplias malabaricus]|uniref:neurotensin receptor type 1-like n=1 Tax=Hoplias malabaricus TaxID=27720 RepID=UPI003461806C
MTVNETLHPWHLFQETASGKWDDAGTYLFNSTSAGLQDNLDVNTDLYSRITVTVLYTLLFALGFFGNSTVLYIFFKRREVKYLQGAVHYHLASLALSDLFVLVLCMPLELYNFIWIHHPWAFGEAVCKGFYFVRDGCSCASSLNVASLSVERYVALCHPLRAKSVLSRTRTRRVLLVLWMVALLLASPMLFTMGETRVGQECICTTIVSSVAAKSVLQVNALLSFVLPMLVISIMNGLIGRQLQQISQQTMLLSYGYQTANGITVETGRIRSLRHGVKVLRVVVIAFVVCWLPYHTRRLMYCYVTEWTSEMYDFYHYFYMVTNVLFYVSSAINPILYNLVSSTYRQIFFSTISYFCWTCSRKGKAYASGRSLQFLHKVPTTLVTPRTSQQTLCTTDVMETIN